MCLQRLALSGATGLHARQRARPLSRGAQDVPRDAETWALLGRVDKDAWTEAWRRTGGHAGRCATTRRYEEALLRGAIESYAQAFRSSPGHYYSGINALTLMHLYRHLTRDGRYDQEMATMAGAVRFAAECETDEYQLFWAKATLGDLEMLVGTPRP